MATLTVRNLEDEVVRRLRIRAAENGRSAEAEHREILKAALVGGHEESLKRRHEAARRLAEFRERTAGRGSQSSLELLRETRRARMRQLLGDDALTDDLF
jgi:plasmid stability protein